MSRNTLQIVYFLLPLWIVVALFSCNDRAGGSPTGTPPTKADSLQAKLDSMRQDSPAGYIVLNRDIRMKQYFPFMDSVVHVYDSTLGYVLTEHLLVRANPWIIDTLASYDYDVRMAKGQFIEDQKEEVMLRKGDTLILPSVKMAALLDSTMAHTLIDVNIPEFKLRIIENGKIEYTFPVRVGRDEQKFLALAGREVSLRTPIGEGEIVRIEKNPIYMNPVDGKRYEATHRDDGKLTKLPQIPFLEPSINGQRPGALIHPTTNPHTLGKSYSNGCVGTRESAAWYIYYHGRIGTKVRFRYELDPLDDHGDTLHLKNIYKLKMPVTKSATLSADALPLACRMDTLPDGSVVHVCK